MKSALRGFGDVDVFKKRAFASGVCANGTDDVGNALGLLFDAAAEFRNRLDAMIPFKSLTSDMMLHIVDKFLAEIRASLAERHVELSLSSSARDWLARHGFDPSMGARPLRRLLRNEVEDKLASALLFGSLQNGGTARLELEADRDELVLVDA